MVLVALSMAFVTLLITANIVAVKLVSIGAWVVPVAVIAYPFTFLVTDTVAEVYGRRRASQVVWLGFAMSLGMLAIVRIGGLIPAASFWQGQEAYESIFGAVPRIVLASIIAYLVSQHHDVIAFDFWKRLTAGRHLWLRNTASTAVSQGIDTVLFITIAFSGTLPSGVLWNMLASQYLIKLLIALADTPFVYALVSVVRKHGDRDLAEVEVVRELRADRMTQ